MSYGGITGESTCLMGGLQVSLSVLWGIVDETKLLVDFSNLNLIFP